MFNNSELTERELESEEPKPVSISDAEYTFGFSVTVNQILELFHNVADQLKFQMIESEQTHAMAVKNAKKNFFQLLDCFNWWSESNITAIKMTIHTSENDSKRKCKLKGLVGSRKQVLDFTREFTQQAKSLASMKQMKVHEDNIEMLEQQTNPFYLESCAAYMFHKILSNKNYGLGSMIHNQINHFNNLHEEVEKAVESLPAPMKEAVNLTEEIVGSLYKDFNYGKQEMEQIMPYCRISVEKYVFEKVYKTLFNIYKVKNKTASEQFNAKKQKILKDCCPKKIFTDIGLGEQLWLIDPDDESLSKDGHLLSTITTEKYKKAYKELEKVKSTHCPREKVKYCQIMYTYLKTIIFEESSGKYELFNMEDIIPTLILILMICDIPNIKEELDMMVDFIGFDPCDLEGERRLLVNMSESFNYVVRDWHL